MSTHNVLRRGRFTFKRVKDGVYLASDHDRNDKFGGIVFTNDPRGRKWSYVDAEGQESTREYRTMTAAAESFLPSS